MSLKKFTPATFAKLFDHTILKPDATDQKVQQVCREAREAQVAAVCVNSIHIPLVARELEGSGVLPITVVGFPLGAVPTAIKARETKLAIGLGAREIDMVVDAGSFLSGRAGQTRSDIEAVIKAAGKIPVKVILETSLFTPEQIHSLTLICVHAGAAFVKTSTGFGSRGASVEDVRTMAEAISSVSGAKTQIKASGGIKTLAAVTALVEAGATRIGSSVSHELIAAWGKLDSHS